MLNNSEQLTYVAAEAPAEERAAFIRRTYQHLGLSILAFLGIEFAIFQTAIPESLTKTMVGGRFSWLIVLGAFMVVSWIAERWAQSSVSREMQYLGLTVYVIAEAIIFVPLLYFANKLSPNIAPMAGLITLLLFAGLTFTAFTTRKDFSFLGGILKITAFVALGIIIASILFGFTLGLVFSSAMVIFAGGAILYTTSNLIHHYNTDQHVAAALSLFASVALLFWYVIRILMSLSSRD